MRGFAVLTLAVLLAIGVGAGVEGASPSVSESLAAAVSRTLSARSLQIVESTHGDGEDVSTTMYFNAPNRFEATLPLTKGPLKVVVVGRTEYLEQGSTRDETVQLHNPTVPSFMRGYPQAQISAFFPLLLAISSRIVSERTVVFGPARNRTSSQALYSFTSAYKPNRTQQYLGGTVTVVNGQVASVTLTVAYTFQTGPRRTETEFFRFGQYDTAPNIKAPRAA